MSSANRSAAAYEAAMVLGAVGDALGYKNGEWEFCHSTERLHAAVERIGFESIVVRPPEFIVSDDTVMHIATARALVAKARGECFEELFHELARQYVACMDDMVGRAPGTQTMDSCQQLASQLGTSYVLPYTPNGGGCGGAMRAMCIGLVFSKRHHLPKLAAVAVEAGRLTHNHPTGFLGSVAAAFFASMAAQSVPLCRWGHELMRTALPAAWSYVVQAGRDVEQTGRDWSYFAEAWAQYLTDRGLLDGRGPVKFPQPYGVAERDAYFQRLSYSGWPGSSGHDAPMIAYDALLAAGADWRELCYRAVLHGGDSDSTGTIAACCFGVLRAGYGAVPQAHYQHVEYGDELRQLGRQLYELSEQL